MISSPRRCPASLWTTWLRQCQPPGWLLLYNNFQMNDTHSMTISILTLWRFLVVFDKVADEFCEHSYTFPGHVHTNALSRVNGCSLLHVHRSLLRALHILLAYMIGCSWGEECPGFSSQFLRRFAPSLKPLGRIAHTDRQTNKQENLSSERPIFRRFLSKSQTEYGRDVHMHTEWGTQTRKVGVRQVDGLNNGKAFSSHILMWSHNRIFLCSKLLHYCSLRTATNAHRIETVLAYSILIQCWMRQVLHTARLSCKAEDWHAQAANYWRAVIKYIVSLCMWSQPMIQIAWVIVLCGQQRCLSSCQMRPP